ncbi:hypothetical protein FE257_006410 [Aspergillus nanangensis]|uniref:Uncharacterized protein n=1 Tax=Aspergillus nanangensis TaxID=2582783 RepID=A0AAD4CXG4_ASPNN|nr:hypothetical protein FE257_006410 [Aspergillus nanangensis]
MPPPPSTDEGPPQCLFTLPCTTTPIDPTTGQPDPPPRKVISHIFGRNKTATKRFPTSVWTYFCRKHYQRARYRSNQWPFTQCQLLQDSLTRMEKWQGVRCFAVVLRRREARRLRGGPDGGSDNDASEPSSQLGLGGGDHEDDAHSHSRGITTKTKTTTKGKGQGKGKAQNKKINSNNNNNNNNNNKKKKKAIPTRRRPEIVPVPVPGWLHAKLGLNKSFDDIRDLLRLLEEDMERQRDVGNLEKVRFPDIEILPTFMDWVPGGSKHSSSSSTAAADGSSSGLAGFEDDEEQGDYDDDEQEEDSGDGSGESEFEWEEDSDDDESDGDARGKAKGKKTGMGLRVGKNGDVQKV